VSDRPKGLKVYAAGEQPDGDNVVVEIYNDITPPLFGGVSTRAVAKALADYTDAATIEVRINSPGGDAAEGLGIYNLLRQHKASVAVRVDGAAFSAASIIAMAGDRIRMARASLMMIHNPWFMAIGSADDLRTAADQLDTYTDALVAAYVESRGLDESDVRSWMDDELYLTGEEAVEFGLADEVIESIPAAAMGFGLEPVDRVPDWVRQHIDTQVGRAAPAPAAHPNPVQETIPMSEKKTPTQADLDEVRAEAAAAERDRIAGIEASLGGEHLNEVRAQAITGAMSLEQAKAAAFDVMVTHARALQQTIDEQAERLDAVAQAGHQPVGQDAADDQAAFEKQADDEQDKASAFQAAVEKIRTEKNVSQGEAIRRAGNADPDGLAAWNKQGL
jgi:ATP-dependent Clp protease protease subunit